MGQINGTSAPLGRSKILKRQKEKKKKNEIKYSETETAQTESKTRLKPFQFFKLKRFREAFN